MITFLTVMLFGLGFGFLVITACALFAVDTCARRDEWKFVTGAIITGLSALIFFASWAQVNTDYGLWPA